MGGIQGSWPGVWSIRFDHAGDRRLPSLVGGYSYGAGRGRENVSGHGRRRADDADSLGTVQSCSARLAAANRARLCYGRAEDLEPGAGKADRGSPGDRVTFRMVAAVDYQSMRAQCLCAVLSAWFLAAPALSHCQAPPGAWATWGVFGGGPDNIHYSSLSQINRENVHSLQVAWRFDSGDQHPGSEMECNPIVVDDVLFATTPNGDAVALDAATGTLRWRFTANEGLRNVGKVRSRGVAYWSDGTDRRIFVGVRQYLFALDAQTGKPIASFGNAGRIDLREGLGRKPLNWVTMTSPAVVYKDLVIVGGGMSETLPASPGDIRAYDAHSGQLRWSFHTVPRPGEFGYKTWPQDSMDVHRGSQQLGRNVCR